MRYSLGYHCYARADPRFHTSLRIRGLHPDLHSCAAGIKSGAYERNLGLKGWPLSRNGNAGLVAGFQVGGVDLRDMSTSHYLRQIHDRDEGSTAGRCFPGIERSVGNHTIDGTGNLGVAIRCFGTRGVTFRGIPLRFGQLKIYLSLREFICVSCLSQRHAGVFDILRGSGPFLVESLATVIEFLLSV